jgi:alpha-L-fucosidase 2
MIYNMIGRCNLIEKGMALVFFLLFMANQYSNAQGDPLALWYDKPARDWMTEALPIGNGYMGAMYFGGVDKEQIQFTEGSLWSGGSGAHPDYNNGNREGAWKYLAEVRALLAEGKMKEAHALASRELSGITHKVEGGPMFGDYGAQMTMGDLHVEIISPEGPVENYRRILDISNSVGKISYAKNGIRHNRTFFASYPDKVLVYRFESSMPVSYSVEYDTPHDQISEEYNNGVYAFHGKLKDNGQEYETRILFESDGNIMFEDGKMLVKDAGFVNLYHTAATEYLAVYPEYSGNRFRENNLETIEQVRKSSYEKVLQRHQQDYRSLFDRVTLDIGAHMNNALPTDKRILAYNQGAADLGFEQLYFQYSRYLMISSTRPGTLPMNLQGKWNHSIDPPWACDYHMNINQQMLYWPAELTNLSECHLPLFDYMESLVEPGRVTAQEHFNMNGWVVNTMNNAYGYTAPGWGFPWGYFPGGAAWLCQHLWEHYEFTKDREFLSSTAYPLMKEAALFWIDYLSADENGYLVSTPSYSPEHGGISTGASMDHQMAWDLMSNCVKASTILDIDKDFRMTASQVRDKIMPPRIGRWGQLQEWKEDVDDPKNNHRHVSHLFALHPGSQISVEHTPELAEAAKVSLNARGDDGTGWSLAWKVNFWARLKDGDRAYKLFRRLLRSTENQGTDMVSGGGTYPNLLCAHPPFQLDGNMGGCAGIAEMLLQSHTGIMELLPALPTAWVNGTFSGLKARGAYEVDVTWNDGILSVATIKGKPGESLTVKYAGSKATVVLDDDGLSTLKAVDFH